MALEQLRLRLCGAQVHHVLPAEHVGVRWLAAVLNDLLQTGDVILYLTRIRVYVCVC